MSSLRLALGLFNREQLPAFYRCLGASWAPSRSVHRSSPSSSSSSSSSGDKTGTDAAHGLPLDPEWAEMAKKQLKGADPQEKLTWRTPEVCSYYNRIIIIIIFVVSLCIKFSCNTHLHL